MSLAFVLLYVKNYTNVHSSVNSNLKFDVSDLASQCFLSPLSNTMYLTNRDYVYQSFW